MLFDAKKNNRPTLGEVERLKLFNQLLPSLTACLEALVQARASFVSKVIKPQLIPAVNTLALSP